MSEQEAQTSPDVIIGMLSVFGIPTKVLIDSGATHSFVANSFAHNANVRLTTLCEMSLQLVWYTKIVWC